jgi:hypothetical protein
MGIMAVALVPRCWRFVQFGTMISTHRFRVLPKR